MINVKLCMMVVLIELYPFMALLLALIVFQGNKSVEQLAENLMFLSCHVECLYDSR